MLRSTHIATALSALALVVPTAASAQGSAGGDNYQDPFPSQHGGGNQSGGGGNSSTSGTSSSSSGNGSSSGTGNGSSGTATTAQGNSSANGASGSGSGSGSASGSHGSLPRTGLDTGVIAFAGALLVLAGAGLRRRIPAYWR